MTHVAKNTFMLSDFPEYITHPLEFLDQLHAQGTIHRINLFSDFPVWLITGYHAAKEALTNPLLCRDSYELQHILHAKGHSFWDPQETERIDRNMLNVDPPDHSRLRKLAVKPFTPNNLAALAPKIRAITNELLNNIAPQTPIDVVQGLAYPLPMTVICDMLDIPVGSQRDNFRNWSNIMFLGQSYDELLVARKNIYRYLTELIAQRRATQSDPNSTNLLDQLIAAHDQGDKLSDVELISTISLLLIAGHETTVNLIGNLIIELSINKELQQQLRSEPGKIPSFVEENLRNNGPVHMALLRYAAEDTSIDGVQIAAHDLVLISLLAANRDPRAFTDPQDINLERNGPKHLGFGFGPHACLGAGLARLEATIVIEEMLQRYSDMDLAVPLIDISWRISNIVRGRTEIPIIVHT